ncbi:MAG: VWA domain-containing protein, partial [Myxococcales bacterium]|nr:VWA domain-containing protein [Myxococcales bacterium]
GGDRPEAAHRALANASELSWSPGDAARVALWVGDAPPHPGDIGPAMAASELLRARGVAVYPVAASGVDPAAEFVMRASALLSGAEYVFLTDDSGVGDPHAEPHIPCYEVEKLARVLLRAVWTEVAGRRSEAGEDAIERRVGQSVAGVCQQTG